MRKAVCYKAVGQNKEFLKKENAYIGSVASLERESFLKSAVSGSGLGENPASPFVTWLTEPREDIVVTPSQGLFSVVKS